MKKVKILVSLGLMDGEKSLSPAPGSVVELSDATAQNLIDVGYAEAAPKPKKKKKAADDNTVDEAIPQPDEPGEPAPKPKKKKKADDGSSD